MIGHWLRHLRRNLFVLVRRELGISTAEANGYIGLLGLMILLHFGITRYKATADLDLRQGSIDSLWQLLAQADTLPGKLPLLRTFDPNMVTYDSLVAMGVEQSVARNLVRYRQAGGKFKQPGDLKKIYGMSDSIWSALEPWMLMKNLGHAPDNGAGIGSHKIFKSSGREAELRDINSVDSAWLKTIYGIGPVLSRRIVKYRDLLGGFVSMGQLLEVYGLSEEVVERMLVKITLDSGARSIKPLNINLLDYKSLARHPYLSLLQAKAIVSYRERHGRYRVIEEIKNIHLIDDSTYLRVSPYLDF